MTISIGNDHAGTAYKFAIIKALENKGITVINHGTNANDSVDYPDFAHLVAQDIENKTAHLGIVICGSGNGIAMTVNKHPNVRAALCWTKEIAALSKQHNNANILAIPARFTALEQALEIVNTFLETSFEGGRHQNRIDKISCT
jgi:ribose 5-phosphate isomerase B